MTAAGFFLYMIGRVIFEFTEDESKAYPFTITGFFLLLFGITQFLWEKAP